MQQPAPLRLGPWVVLASVVCFALALFLLVYRLIAALIVAGILGLAGCALLGLGTTLWRTESALRRRGEEGRPPFADPEIVKNAEGTWRDGSPP